MIVIKNLYKSFDGFEVLKGINLVIETGEAVAIMGRSGTGKSVLVKHIVRLLRPTKGEVYVDGVRVDNADEKTLMEVRKKFGYVFQMGALFDFYTIEQNLYLPLYERGIRLSKQELRKKAAAVLERVGLDERVLDLYPDELSGGMRKRAAIARAIITQPKYIIYDEPTTGLDPITADLINDLIADLNEELHTTTIVITHDLRCAFKTTHRIVLLYDGRIVFEGTPEEALRSDVEEVKRFIQAFGIRELVEEGENPPQATG